MQQLIYDLERTHRCGSLRAGDIGQEVVLMGWVNSQRDLGGCVFVDLRDREGITQVVFDPADDAALHEKAGAVRLEWVIGVVGVVRSRGQNANTKLPTGEIEVVAERLEIFARSKATPFVIEDEIDAHEDTRLKYRYLDLRRPRLQKNLMLRHRFNQITRRTLDEEGFLELETPFLIKSTPEGARDYVVPSRVHSGSFFALPQSPQLFKQLFMIAGYDRYFQIARCFRDEDLRAERQPEFSQVDIEMSFVSPKDVQGVVERLLARVWKDLAGIEIPTPFPRMDYDEAMARYGVDAPDLRYRLELVDIGPQVKDSSFKVFSGAIESGGCVKGINLKDTGSWSRKQLDELGELAKVYGAKGLAWLKVMEDGSWQSPIAKFFADAERAALAETLDLTPGDVAVFVADKLSVANAALGNLRKKVASERGLIAKGTHSFVWITSFPLFEWDEEEQRYFAAHHPFTAPVVDHIPWLREKPDQVRAQAYDIVLNGVEIGGGSIRIHDSQLQANVLDALGIGKDEAEAKFGFLLDALQYGAPPHGGVALGVDRIMMLLCQTESIRDVIAFPKTQRQTDLMLDAPAPLDSRQLEELHIQQRDEGGGKS